MNETFVFGGDRFGPDADFSATYRQLGGTRLSERAVREAIHAVFGWLRERYEEEAYSERFPSLSEAFRTATPAVPSDEIAVLSHVFARHETGHVPGTHAAALHRLAQTHRLGVVSNVWAPSDAFRQVFMEAGIADLFEVIVFSSDHGSLKPSPALFHHALDALDVPRDAILFVGDDLHRDVRAAQAIGLASVWLCTDADAATVPDPPDLILPSLCDLPDAPA